jgi:hypothetical protein
MNDDDATFTQLEQFMGRRSMDDPQQHPLQFVLLNPRVEEAVGVGHNAWTE